MLHRFFSGRRFGPGRLTRRRFGPVTKKHVVGFQDDRQLGVRLPERRATGRKTDGQHQLLHTAGRLRARPVDRPGVDDGGRPFEVAHHRVGALQGAARGRAARLAGPVRARGHRHQAAVRRPKEAAFHRPGADHQSVHTVPGRAYHVSLLAIRFRRDGSDHGETATNGRG